MSVGVSCASGSLFLSLPKPGLRARAVALRFYSDHRMGGLIIMETGSNSSKDGTGRCGGAGCMPPSRQVPLLLGMC